MKKSIMRRSSATTFADAVSMKDVMMQTARNLAQATREWCQKNGIPPEQQLESAGLYVQLKCIGQLTSLHGLQPLVVAAENDVDIQAAATQIEQYVAAYKDDVRNMVNMVVGPATL